MYLIIKPRPRAGGQDKSLKVEDGKMKGTIFEFLNEYGEALLQILGFAECRQAYGHAFVVWYNNYHTFTEDKNYETV